MRTETTDYVKELLLKGRKLTVAQLDKMLSTNNSAEVVNRLRKKGMKIATEWRINKTTGKRYGVYYAEQQNSL